jgi:hypothetical protein
MVNRTNFAYAVVGDVTRQNGLGMNVSNILPPPGSRTDQACLDAVAGLLRVDLTDAEEADLLAYMNTARQADGTVVASPFDGNSQAHLDERVRGIVYILAQHPGFQVK